MKRRVIIYLISVACLVSAGGLWFTLSSNPSIDNPAQPVVYLANVAAIGDRQDASASSSLREHQQSATDDISFAAYANGDRYDGKPDEYVDIPQPTFGYDYDEDRVFGPDMLVVNKSVEFLPTELPSFAESDAVSPIGPGYYYTEGGFYGGYYVTPPLVTPSAVPEPASWVMMLVGFFGVGAIIRRHAIRGHAA